MSSGCHNLLLPNPPLEDQGAPPAAARSARRPGNVDRIHRGSAGCRSAHAGRPARRSPRAGDGSTTTGGAIAQGAAGSSLGRNRRTPGRRYQRRCASLRDGRKLPPLTPTTRRYETACTREPERCGSPLGTLLAQLVGPFGEERTQSRHVDLAEAQVHVGVARERV